MDAKPKRKGAIFKMGRSEPKNAPQAKSPKVYVTVRVEFTKEGQMLPRSLTWEDGTRYIIDKVLDCKPAAAMRSGGQGERFTIRVQGQERYLFFERSTAVSGTDLGKWFVERKIS